NHVMVVANKSEKPNYKEKMITVIFHIFIIIRYKKQKILTTKLTRNNLQQNRHVQGCQEHQK
ncbi:MAG: hypothetical protein Q7T32_11605, partial [Moraxellaceae bacterium]|nr:hypothetical protein [Moraxellaceae bacterium]